MARSKSLQYGLNILAGRSEGELRWLTGPVLARTFGSGYEAIKRGCDSGRDVDQRCAGVYRL